MRTTVQYQVAYATFDVSAAEYDLIKSMYDIGQKIQAIKFLRNQCCIGLKEAKDICDAIGK